MATLPRFSLNDLDGNQRSFPNSQPTLLCFVREECETCHLSMPVIEAVYRAYGGAMNLWVIGQEDNQKLRDRYQVTVPILDDTALKVSFAYQVEIVPTIILADATGAQVTRWEAFHQGDWKDL
ncbi:MAG TPA: redoxin domain-containing protein, partial [Candidatus Binataceae bacterium]|nr:redoxin domain-containing protein [Candidatus Binataceae bacterium]